MSILVDVGVIEINDEEMGLTRGGFEFVVERELRDVTADGDFGPVKGRKRINTNVARLTVNMLEVDPQKAHLLYSAVDVATSDGKTTITGRNFIKNEDYVTVKAIGRTNDGRDVIITLRNALNVSNINWAFVDKDEVVQQVVFEAAYSPDTRNVPPYTIEYIEAEEDA